MKINDAVIGATIAGANIAPPAPVPAAGAVPALPSSLTAPPTTPEPTDRVSRSQLAELQTSVTSGVNIAASERSARLDQLARVVRAGTYRPNPSQLADQILAEAELDARLSKLVD